ncbi:MAG: CHASE3 domain-containing protein [Syntrophobacteraceae bacterium]
MKIRWLLLLGVASLIVVFAGLLTAVYLAGAKILDTEETIAHTRAVIAKVRTLQAGILDLQADGTTFAMVGGKTLLEHVKSDPDAIEMECAAIRQLVSDDPEERAKIDRLEEQYHDWLQTQIQPLTALRQQVDKDALPFERVIEFMNSSRGVQPVREMRNTLLQIEHEELLHLGRHRAALAYFTNLARRAIVFGGGAGILFGLLIAFLTERKVAGPIEELASYAGRVSAGNYSPGPKIKRKDEIGILADALQSMVATLVDHIAFRTRQTELLENTAAELRAEMARQDELQLRLQDRSAELQTANEELRRLPSRLIAAQEEERRRLSSELHDSVGQVLIASKVRIEYILNRLQTGRGEEAAQAAEQFIPTLQRSIDETRAIYMGLRPKVLEDFGVIAALHWYREEMMQLHPERHIEMHIGINETEIPKDLVVPIFRIAQEALNNTYRHSNAEWVDVRLSRDSTSIKLIISDDGQGMDLDLILKSSACRSLGLVGMRERAELTGGNLTIESARGAGTTVRVIWRIEETETASHPSA